MSTVDYPLAVPLWVLYSRGLTLTDNSSAASTAQGISIAPIALRAALALNYCVHHDEPRPIDDQSGDGRIVLSCLLKTQVTNFGVLTMIIMLEGHPLLPMAHPSRPQEALAFELDNTTTSSPEAGADRSSVRMPIGFSLDLRQNGWH